MIVDLRNVTPQEIQMLCRKHTMSHEYEWLSGNLKMPNVYGVFVGQHAKDPNPMLVGLLDFDIQAAYLNIIDIAESFWNRGIACQVLARVFQYNPQINEIYGCSTPEASYFWCRIGAIFETPLGCMYEAHREAIEMGQDGAFFNFSLNRNKFMMYMQLKGNRYN